MDPVLALAVAVIGMASLALVAVGVDQQRRKEPAYRLRVGELSVRCARIVEAGDPFAEVAVDLPTPLRLPTEAHLEHQPGLADMGWTRAWLHGDPDEDWAMLEFDGSDRWRLMGDARSLPRAGDVGPQMLAGPVPRYRILVKLRPDRLALGFAHVTSHERLERIGQAVGALAEALLDEQQRPLRQLAARLGLEHEPDAVVGQIQGVDVQLRRTQGYSIRLEFPSSLPLGFEARRGDRLPSGSRFDNPVLDMLLVVKNPPSDERFDDPRAAELCLKLLHGHQGRLQKHRLELRAAQVELAGELLEEGLELIRRVARP